MDSHCLLTPQACAISLVSHHFADDFGQSKAKALPRQTMKTKNDQP